MFLDHLENETTHLIKLLRRRRVFLSDVPSICCRFHFQKHSRTAARAGRRRRALLCQRFSLTVLCQQRCSVGDGLQRQPDIGAVGPEHQQRLQDGQQLEGHWGAAHLHKPDTKSKFRHCETAASLPDVCFHSGF